MKNEANNTKAAQPNNVILYSKDAASKSHIVATARRRSESDGATVIAIGHKAHPAYNVSLSIKQLKNLVTRAEAFEKQAIEAEKAAAEAEAAKAARKAKRDAKKAAKAVAEPV